MIKLETYVDQSQSQSQTYGGTHQGGSKEES